MTPALPSNLPTVIYVWAAWCGPCRAMAPALDRVQQQYAGRVIVHKIDADASPEAVQALNVFGIPTLIVRREGREIARRAGAQSAAALNELFEAALSSQPLNLGPARAERALRLFAALVLLVIGMLSGPSFVLLAVSSVVAFSAVYDRCPLWRAVLARYGAGVTSKSGVKT